MTTPFLSVVIPTMGRPILIQTVESLTQTNRFAEIEVWVAGKVHHADTARDLQALVDRYENIHHLPVEFAVGDSSEKKNAGAREARAPLVAFLDDDVFVAPHWPEKIVEAFEDPSVGLVSGPSLVPPDVSRMAQLAGLALSSRAAGYVSYRYRKGEQAARPVKWSNIIGCNMCYRKSVLESIGWFDPEFWPGEEMIASWHTQQSGARLLFHPEAWVYHYPRHSLVRFWKQVYGYGATRIRLLRGGVEWEWTTLVPMAWVASLVVLGLCCFAHRLFAWLLLLDLLAYLVVDLWISVETFRETGRWSSLWLLFVIPVMHLSYGLAGWTELMRPGKDLSEVPPQ